MFAAAALSLGLGAASGSDAFAHCNRCTGGPTPPPTVNPPPPPPPTQPPAGCRTPGCGHGGIKVVVPPVVIPPPSVSINYGGSAFAVVNQTVAVSASAGGGGMVFRGGGLVGDVDAGVSGGGMLNVVGAQSETVVREIKGQRVIQASCIDDRGGIHDASQTFGGEAVPEAYAGEIYRCMAGAKMRVVVGKMVDAKANFDDARTFECAKGEALVYQAHLLSCRTQEAKRPCNERSLLRRYGPGMKLVTVRETETVTTERRQTISEQSMTLSFDGGVGQSVW
jgi:hypothetical protein